MTDRQAVTRERAASAAQYILLGGFAAVAAGISAQGLTGFARSNMALRGPWPYLLFFALDGAAGVCAVLLARRATRADGGLAPRLAVWGLVTASAFFNFTHAPRRPAAPQAYALMPVIAAVLFEFCLGEMRTRRTSRDDRRLSGLRWLHPVERVRVQLHMAADERASAAEATRRVRIEQAARRLYQLRTVLRAHDRQGRPGMLTAARARRAQRRAHAALIRSRFSAPDVAAEVLRQVQVLTMTATLAQLDYGGPEGAQAAIASLITPPAAPGMQSGAVLVQTSTPEHAADHAEEPYRGCATGLNGHDASGTVTGLSQPRLAPSHRPPSRAATGGAGRQSVARRENPAYGDDHDAELIAAATRIVADATRDGGRLSQVALAEKLRSQGYSISNQRLRWLSAASGLESRTGRPPGQRASAHQDEEALPPVSSAPRHPDTGFSSATQGAVLDPALGDDPWADGQPRNPSGNP